MKNRRILTALICTTLSLIPSALSSQTSAGSEDKVLDNPRGLLSFAIETGTQFQVFIPGIYLGFVLQGNTLPRTNHALNLTLGGWFNQFPAPVPPEGGATSLKIHDLYLNLGFEWFYKPWYTGLSITLNGLLTSLGGELGVEKNPSGILSVGILHSLPVYRKERVVISLLPELSMLFFINPLGFSRTPELWPRLRLRAAF